MEITTERLILHAATITILTAELAYLRDASQQDALEQALGAEVISWPPLYNDETTCAYTLEKLTTNPKGAGWGLWYVLLNKEMGLLLLVGSAGFHNPPDDTGSVEIGYSIIELFQRQGIATDCVKVLTLWAFSHKEITRIQITTLDLPELVPSTKVAQRSGYTFVGSRESDEGTLLVYESTREKYKQGRGG